MTDPNCIFCKIAAGQIPSHKIYEDENIFAFLDIGPLTRGHTLVIPKFHAPTTMDAPPEILANIAKKLPALAKAVLAAAGAKACHILTNNGSDAKQTVHHLHYHIIPRTPGDGFDIPWHPGKLDNASAAALLADIHSALRG